MARAPATAVAKKSNNLPVSTDIAAQVAAMIAGVQDRVNKPSGDNIRITQNKEFELPDGRKSDGPLDLIILDFVSFNAFYEGRYDPNNITPPLCFSLGTVVQQMVPSENSTEPQCTTCAACPMNQFGSEGSGKACKNKRRLAVIPADFDEDTPIYTLDVSPTGLKSFDKYVSSLASVQRKVPAQLITEVAFDPARDYPSLTFKAKEALDASTVAAVFSRIEAARTRIATEPDMSAATAEKPAKAARGKPPARRGSR